MTNLDIIILVIFLIAIVFIGLQTGQTIKTFKDYAIGNRRFSDFALFCTAAATMIGGSSTIGLIGQVYKIGVTQILVQLGVPIAFIITAFFCTVGIQKFYGCLSLGDIFYKAYGKPGKIIGGLLACLYETFQVSVQFMAMAVLLQTLTGYSYNLSLILSAGIIFIYTGRGGVRAVTFTDILQFMVFIVGIPLLAIIALDKVGGYHTLLTSLPRPHLTLTDTHLRRYLLLFLVYSFPNLSPVTTQRLLMSQNRRQGFRSYLYSSLIYGFLVLVSLIVGLCACVLYPHLSSADQALPTLMQTCLPIGIYGFVMVAFLAVLMSSADSLLNATSVAFVNDLILPCCKHPLAEKTKLRLAWLISLLAALLAVFLAQDRTSVFEFRVWVHGLYFPAIVIPLYAALANRKISRVGFFCCALTGFTTSILWNLYLKSSLEVDGILPGFIMNLMVFILFYFFGKNKGFIFSKEELAQIEAHRQLQSFSKG